jgi:hypothetical protein
MAEPLFGPHARTVSRRAVLRALAGGVLLGGAAAGCKPKNLAAPALGQNLKLKLDDLNRPPREGDPRRQLFAQIVEDGDPDRFSESAVIEGAPFKYFLRSLLHVSHDAVRKFTDESALYENLLATPGLYRGRVVTLARGVVIEVSRAVLPPDYGMPPGTAVLPAIFIDASRDIYALRILSSADSDCFEKLEQGLLRDQLPVLRVSGYFMKNYARKTADENEPPWRKPLLVCPEPEFSQAVPPRKVMEELRDTKTDRFLPSARIEAPGAEERMIVELLPGGAANVDGDAVRGALDAAIARGLAAFTARLPQDQRAHPAAVVMVAIGAGRERQDEAVAALQRAGLKRLALKVER